MTAWERFWEWAHSPLVPSDFKWLIPLALAIYSLGIVAYLAWVKS